MSRRAFIESGAEDVSAHLTRLGWQVIDPKTAPLEQLADQPDLVVGAIRATCAEADLRRIATLHAIAPDLALLVVADELDDGAGHALYDLLIDVPIIRHDSSDTCVAAAIAAA